MKRLLSFILLLMSGLSVAAQSTRPVYTWGDAPSVDMLTDEMMQESIAILKDTRILDFREGETGELMMYDIKHEISYVNDDRALEVFNKVYIPLGDGDELVDFKARTVKKNGEVVEIGESSLYDMENVEDYGSFKIVAIDGLEKGGFVEYYYSIYTDASYYGRETFQSDVATWNAHFELRYPDYVGYETKSYNNFPEAVKSDYSTGYIWTIEADYLPPLLEEKYTAYNANLGRVDYKLTNNNSITGSTELFTYDQAAARYWEVLYDVSLRDQNTIRKELDDANINTADLQGEDLVMALDKWIKQNIVIKDGSGEDFEDVTRILKNKYASEFGMQKLYAAIMLAFDIPHETVFTTDRFQTKFDPDFQSWQNLQEGFIYLPDYGLYLIPTSEPSVYGYPPYEWTDNYGLFFKDVDGEVVSDVRFIETAPAEYTESNIEASMRLSEDFSSLEIDMKDFHSGYRGIYFRWLYSLIDDEAREEFVVAQMQSIAEDAEVSETGFGNTDVNDSYSNKYFEMYGQIDAPSLVEKAGNRYLVSIGDVIGPQNELYQETERTNPVEFDNTIIYNRKLTFEIPEGYEVKNPEDLKIDIEIDGKDGSDLIGFVSDYTYEGNTIVTTIKEYYYQLQFPKEQFEEFRAVVNAAADFNKVVLVVSPKE